jgi:hypothetical protein
MIKRYRKTAVSQYLFVGFFLAVLVLLGYLSTILMRAVPFVDYFALPWSAGRAWLLEGRNPYDPDISKLAADVMSKTGYSGQLPDVNNLVHPLVNLFFFLPFSLLPYPISRAIWTVILMVLAGLIVHLSQEFSEWKTSSFDKFFCITFLLLWFPSIYTILTGRLTLIIIFLMVYGLWSLKVEKYRRAGFMLALVGASLPLTAFVIFLAIFWSIARRQWSFLVAFVSGSVFLWSVSLLMLPSWPLDWLRILVGTYQDVGSWVETPLMSLASILPGIENFLSIGLHVFFGLVVLVLWIRLFGKSTRVFIWNGLMIFIISFLLQVQSSLSDLLLLVPPLCLILRYASERWKLPGRLAGWAILVFISAGSWILALPEISFLENMSMPIVQTGLSLMVLLGMVWIHWWAVRLISFPKT